jgi:hypothetical protein
MLNTAAIKTRASLFTAMQCDAPLQVVIRSSVWGMAVLVMKLKAEEVLLTLLTVLPAVAIAIAIAAVAVTAVQSEAVAVGRLVY